MKHPLFKDPTDALSRQEETAITEDLAAAYKQSEVVENRAELRRITLAVEVILREQA